MQSKKKKKKTGLYIMGSIALAVGAIIVMPKVLDCLSDKMYDNKPLEPVDDDDWGPEIVKREKKEEAPDGEL